MKTHSPVLAAIVSLCVLIASPAFAQITIPNADGSDGQLVISSGTNIINLASAGTGSWLNTSASPGNGTYDPTNWAVVFKYTNVNIAANTMLTFSNHPTHAPVVWLVNGNVTISGNLNLDGKTPNADPLNLTEPGPGGFRGGGDPLYGVGPGFGPGGYNAGGYGFASYYGSYGNPQIIPLIGGSGGGGRNGLNGGAGGGAILIAATGTITISNTGYVHADGSIGSGSGGSGGAIKLVANQILGNGAIEAISFFNNTPNGRIRLEANVVSAAIANNPVTVGVAPVNPPTIFPTNTATVTILSVGGTNAPSDPKALMTAGTAADDIAMSNTNAVTILLQTQNFPTTGAVTVYLKPRNGADMTILSASYVSGNSNAAIWSVQTTLRYPGHTVIQAQATY